MEDSFIVGEKNASDKKWGLRRWKALDFKKWGGGSSLGALQKFTPLTAHGAQVV